MQRAVMADPFFLRRIAADPAKHSRGSARLLHAERPRPARLRSRSRAWAERPRSRVAVMPRPGRVSWWEALSAGASQSETNEL
jgi:hypothetical protein